MQSDSADSYFVPDGKPGLLLVIADISKLREEQERARAAALQAVLADEERAAAIREGFSAATFRLEEPTNIMATATAVLQRRDPASASVLQQALAASRKHLEALRQVIPQGPQEIVVPINLNEILRDVLEIRTPRLLGAGIVVDWQPAVTLPPIIDRPLQLRLLFKALVDNAIHYNSPRSRNAMIRLNCASCRKASSSASAVAGRSRSMCPSSPPPTATWKPPSKWVISARISSTG